MSEKTQLKLRVYTYIYILNVKLNAHAYVYFKPRALENILSQKNMCFWSNFGRKSKLRAKKKPICNRRSYTIYLEAIVMYSFVQMVVEQYLYCVFHTFGIIFASMVVHHIIRVC